MVTLRSTKELEDAGEKNSESKKSEKTHPSGEIVEEEHEKPHVPPHHIILLSHFCRD